jgi:FkbM family methyltransferase
MDNSLIIDVGMHNGRDTEFYLQKGFNVVAIEANPALAKQARSHFQDDLSSKRLILHEIAIADHEGDIDFYINTQNDDWSTTSEEFALRNESFGTNNTLIHVKCTTFETILRQHEIPYYLKIDIEGADTLCLKALMEFKEKPKYISIEAGHYSFEETFTELSLLWNFGYRKFKIVNQALNASIRCPNPPLEGSFVDYRFDGTCSGPFGEEAPGEWMSIEKTFVKYRRLLTEQKYFGAAGKLHKTPFQRLYEILKREPVGWYDIHAKLAGNG